MSSARGGSVGTVAISAQPVSVRGRGPVMSRAGPGTLKSPVSGRGLGDKPLSPCFAANPCPSRNRIGTHLVRDLRRRRKTSSVRTAVGDRTAELTGSALHFCQNESGTAATWERFKEAAILIVGVATLGYHRPSVRGMSTQPAYNSSSRALVGSYLHVFGSALMSGALVCSLEGLLHTSSLHHELQALPRTISVSDRVSVWSC